jgi:hypothetical protein
LESEQVTQKKTGPLLKKRTGSDYLEDLALSALSALISPFGK